MSKEKEMLNIIRKYALTDHVFFDKDIFKRGDYTPQFEQDASNCWFYSMCNNAYYNLNGDFTLADLIDIKNLMRDYGFDMKKGGHSTLAGAFIAKYLSEKWGVEVRLFQIDFFKSTSKFSGLFKLGVVFEMSRIDTPLLYTDAFDDGKVNQVYYEYQATGHHATNICYDPDKKLLKELGTWGNSKNNQFYYDILQFGMNIKTGAISPLFTFFEYWKMNRPYKEFVEKRLGKKINYDGAYGYQCVDLIKQYLDECLGMGKIGAIGNANQVPKNLEKKGFGELDPKKTIIQGDIIVHTQGIMGHIAIVDHILGDFVYVLEQNGSGKDSGSGEGQNAIRIHPYKIDRFQKILRNTDIVSNYNKEVEYVEDKIEERANLLKITTEYRESMQHLSKK